MASIRFLMKSPNNTPMFGMFGKHIYIPRFHQFGVPCSFQKLQCAQRKMSWTYLWQTNGMWHMNFDPRTSVVNINYSKHEARSRVLETLTWSINALSSLPAYIWHCNSFSYTCALSRSTIFSLCFSSWGIGKFPDSDPWGIPFSSTYEPARYKVAGKSFLPGGPVWKAVLEGISCDQDYLRIMFDLQRGPNQQLCCPFCDSIQWISNKAPRGPLNTPEALYTNWSTDSDRKTLDCWAILYFEICWIFFNAW